MAASDPSPSVATPTGALQGVAAFSWDGSAWQPSGRAGPDVATPTGVLQGVAPFSWSGSAWTPAGRAQPGVATPTGVLDGVAVYTWSGSAWTPIGGTATPSTPSGALRGVAAFSWDGAAWQPAAQARPSVPTPYGVLDGVAMFEWGGTTWQAGAAVPAGATLDLSFMSGTLNPSLTFTRASTATYFDSSGVMQTAATNATRFDYDPVTHAALGLLIEEQRTNSVLQSNSFGTAPWNVSTVTLTTGVAGAPDGTATVTRVVEIAASGLHNINQSPTLVASTSYAVSLYAKAAEVRYLQISLDDGANNGGYATFDVQAGVVSQALTARGTGVIGTAAVQAIGNGFYRCSIVTTIGASTAGRLVICTSNSATPGFFPVYTGNAANGLLVWGVSLEQGGFPTSYIPTTAAAVTRSAERCTMPTGAWFSGTTSTLFAEAVFPVSGTTNDYQVPMCIDDGTTNNRAELLRITASNTYDGIVEVGGSNLYVGVMALVPGAITKAALTFQNGDQRCATNGVLGPSATTAGTVLSGMTTLHVGTTSDNTQLLNGYIRRVRYWPRVLSNAELQSVTT